MTPHPPTRQAHIAVIGAGFTGMVCALTLAQAGYRVTLLEAQPQLGGLSATHHFGLFSWDRFYHCILTSDADLLQLLRKLDLLPQLRWTTTKVGFYAHGRLHTLTSPADLLRFPHLSLFNKLRMALGTLYASRLTNGLALERIPLSVWTRRVFGRRVYHEMWEPLFRCKLGEQRHQASAAFLWGTLRRLYSTRQSGPRKQEKLGYLRGGYRTLFDRLTARLLQQGVTIRTAAPLKSIAAADTGVQVTLRDQPLHDQPLRFDAAILTVPNPVVARCLHIADPARRDAYHAQLQRVSYLGILCVVLVLRKSLSPYYVTNITEPVPFTGIIEMTNLIDRHEETADTHLIYLPRYTSPDDPLFSMPDDHIWQHFAPALQRLHPSLQEADIITRFVFRERTVQPVPTLHYSSFVPAACTPVPRVYLANTAQIVNNTLNNNVMASLAHAACAQLMQQVPAQLAQLPAADEFAPAHPSPEGAACLPA